MKHHNLLAVFVTVMVLLGLSAKSFAGEIKVADSRGLTRGIKEIRGSATVIVTLGSITVGSVTVGSVTVGSVTASSDQPAQAVVLSNINGLAPDIIGVPVAPRSIRFENVPEGEWRIHSSTGNLSVLTVDIR